jgi:hypothetical protein
MPVTVTAKDNSGFVLLNKTVAIAVTNATPIIFPSSVITPLFSATLLLDQAENIFNLRKQISNRRLYAKISKLIIESNNDLAKILVLEEYKSSLSNKAVETVISNANSWLLCYHLFYKNYITKAEFSNKSHVIKNLPFYAKLKHENFSFYK